MGYAAWILAALVFAGGGCAVELPGDNNDVETLTVERAEALASHEGEALSLRALTEISPEVAEALAKHEGVLWLGGLTEISAEVAEALAEHEFDLALSGLTEIFPQVAELLTKHEGQFYPDRDFC